MKHNLRSFPIQMLLQEYTNAIAVIHKGSQQEIVYLQCAFVLKNGPEFSYTINLKKYEIHSDWGEFYSQDQEKISS